MAFKMKGFEGPFKQSKNKGKTQGPINWRNEPLMPGENDDTWIYGRGYKGGEDEFSEMGRHLNNPKLGKKFVKSERIADYEDRAEALYSNDLSDAQDNIDNAKGKKKKKAQKKKKQLKSTISSLQHEADILRDSSFKKKSPMKQGRIIPEEKAPIKINKKVFRTIMEPKTKRFVTVKKINPKKKK